MGSMKAHDAPQAMMVPAQVSEAMSTPSRDPETQ